MHKIMGQDSVPSVDVLKVWIDSCMLFYYLSNKVDHNHLKKKFLKTLIFLIQNHMPYQLIIMKILELVF